jgi:glycosyltransferase involved in cell wall biosynthesis
LREIRRVGGETQRQLAEVNAAVARLEAGTARLTEQLLEAQRFLHSQGEWRRRRLEEVRAGREYERPYAESDPLVSVVIPTYDNYRLLRERSLPSVLSQSYENVEIVVVGDAAPDEARLAVESFNDPRIRFVNLPYRGPYPDDPETRWRVAGVPPHNEGVRRAGGLWIAPLADDDAFRPQHLEHLLAHARGERLEFAYGRLCMHGENGETHSIGRFPPEHGHFGIQAAIYHRGIAEIFELQLSDAPLGLPSDWGMCLRMMEAGVRIGMLDEDTVDYFPSRVWTPRWEE